MRAVSAARSADTLLSLGIDATQPAATTRKASKYLIT
jgi:hypothetical protein